MKTIASTVLLLLALLLTGCSAKKDDSKKDNTKKEEKDEHDHGPGPHKGLIIEWGPNDKYHLEFTVDHKTEDVRVYILGSDAKTAKPIKTDKLTLTITKPAFQIDLTPQKAKDDPEGTTSCFAGKHKNFGVEQEFAGSVTGLVEGKPYTGDFKEEAPKK